MLHNELQKELKEQRQLRLYLASSARSALGASGDERATEAVATPSSAPFRGSHQTLFEASPLNFKHLLDQQKF